MKRHLLVLAVFFLAAIAGAGFTYAALCRNQNCNFVTNTDSDPVNSFQKCAAAGYPVMESFPRQCRMGERLFVEPTSNDSQVTEGVNIKVFAPTPNAEIRSPVLIRGEARVFENQFAYRLRDADGTELVRGMAAANSPDVGQFGGFELTVNFPRGRGTSGTIEVFQYSAQDGSEIDKVVVPVRFSQ